MSRKQLKIDAKRALETWELRWKEIEQWDPTDIPQSKQDQLVDLAMTSGGEIKDALEACGEMGVNIEIKNELESPGFDPEHTMVPGVVEIAKPLILANRCLISSFDMGAINAVRDLNPSIPTAMSPLARIGLSVSKDPVTDMLSRPPFGASGFT